MVAAISPVAKIKRIVEVRAAAHQLLVITLEVDEKHPAGAGVLATGVLQKLPEHYVIEPSATPVLRCRTSYQQYTKSGT